MGDRKEITKAEVKRAVQRAFKKVLKEIDDEPKLIITKAYPDKAVSDSKQLEDILSWLFMRREVKNG